ncbi:YceI family protein [Acuticoccus sp. MNP-M23]|uniref:YceI family protein n=1 Tax=Acuticoccus sp. MNP-M23 TaxID=3072793 RepID=UPI002815AE6E|nr:YceI family protein [Acuticoccus sp. MNP-M23]WMS44929.1 YceI family protein [Acuticoccus sp. MNP-M23]
MRTFIAAAAIAFALPAAAESLDVPSGTYVLDKTHASVVWKINHLGFSTYTAMFERAGIDATITLDADDVAKSSLTASVDVNEVLTGHTIEFDPRSIDFDQEIASDMFLNAPATPVATFESTGIEVTGENTANITGNLTLNNQTHPLVLETTLNGAGDNPMSGAPHIGVTATGVIDRTMYGINTLAGPVGTDVTIEIQGEFAYKE